MGERPLAVRCAVVFMDEKEKRRRRKGSFFVLLLEPTHDRSRSRRRRRRRRAEIAGAAAQISFLVGPHPRISFPTSITPSRVWSRNESRSFPLLLLLLFLFHQPFWQSDRAHLEGGGAGKVATDSQVEMRCNARPVGKKSRTSTHAKNSDAVVCHATANGLLSRAGRPMHACTPSYHPRRLQTFFLP